MVELTVVPFRRVVMLFKGPKYEFIIQKKCVHSVNKYKTTEP